MAVDSVKLNNLNAEIADSSKDVEDLTKSINKLISDSKTLTSSTLQNSKDLVEIYKGILEKTKNISDTNIRSKLAEDAIKNINAQKQEILNKVNELKQQGLILDDEVIKRKKFEFHLENQLIKLKIEAVKKQLASTADWDKDKKKFLEEEVRKLELKKRYNDVEKDFLKERQKKGNKYQVLLSRQLASLNETEDKYENLTKKSSEWVKHTNKIADQLKKLEPIYKPLGKLFGETGKELGGMVKEIGTLIVQGKKLEALYKIIGSYISIVVDRFVDLQNTAESFRKESGLMVSQTRQIDTIVRNTNIQYQAFGVSLKDAYNAVKDLADEFKTIELVTQDLVETTVLLATNFNVVSTDAAGFLANMKRISNVSSDTAGNYAAYAIDLSKAAQVPLSKVMADVKNATSDVLGLLRGNSAELIKAATHARKYGVEITNIATAARKMLNFYESVNDEMEASVILGQQISFQKARELSFTGDLVGFQDEILNIVGKIQDFDKRSVLEKEALARASGIELKDLMKMVHNKREIDKLGSTEKARYYELLKLNNQRVELTGKELLQQQEMQSAMTKLENAFKRIKLVIAESIGPALNDIANLISFLADKMSGTTDKTKQLNDASKELGSSWLAWTTLILGTIGGMIMVGVAILSINKAMILLGQGSMTSMRLFSVGLRSLSLGMAQLANPKAALGAAVLTLAVMGLAFAFKMAAEGVKTFVESLQILASMGIVDIAKSISALSAALVGLTTGFAVATILGTAGLVGMIQIVWFLNSLSEMSTGLEKAAKAIEKLANSFMVLKNVGPIQPIITPKFVKGLNGDLEKIAGASDMIQAASTTKIASTTVNPPTQPINANASPTMMVNSPTQPINANASSTMLDTVSTTSAKSENFDDIKSLTQSVDNLLKYLKSGNAMAKVYLDSRELNRNFAMTTQNTRVA